ncbi:hypothetical protein Bca101_064332 [Brassica carinata]
MYRERGSVGSRPEVVDRKRINQALERPSPSTSLQVNGKGKGTVTASSAHSVKQPHDHRDSRSVSLSKNNVSDDTDSEEESDVSGSDTSWISWFCNLKGNEFFCEVDDDYIQDDFNLCGLSSVVPYYEYALDLILDVESSHGEMFTEEQNELIESAAEMLYGLIHARYILTTKGLAAMLDKYKNYDFGRCPRVYCCGQPCLPVGQSDLPRSSTGHKQWLAEVQFLGVVNHQNVVNLLGYCSEDGENGMERLLVYEYMSNRSLEEHLFTRGARTIPWRQRLEIMLGAAEGLAYLHQVKVIYRDFKSSNVLLNNEFCPKLSDFGLAREGPQGENTHVTTVKVGTQGYAAPEYVQTGHLRLKSDVYSFGVVLYEVITGRRTIERNKPANERRLLEWVKEYPADSQRFNMIVDPRLRSNYPSVGARTLAKLADLCLKKDDKERPTMEIVVERFKKIIEECNTGE